MSNKLRVWKDVGTTADFRKLNRGNLRCFEAAGWPFWLSAFPNSYEKTDSTSLYYFHERNLNTGSKGLSGIFLKIISRRDNITEDILAVKKSVFKRALAHTRTHHPPLQMSGTQRYPGRSRKPPPELKGQVHPDDVQFGSDTDNSTDDETPISEMRRHNDVRAAKVANMPVVVEGKSSKPSSATAKAPVCLTPRASTPWAVTSTPWRPSSN